jgi:hypothetical protein
MFIVKSGVFVGVIRVSADGALLLKSLNYFAVPVMVVTVVIVKVLMTVINMRLVI